MATIFAVYNAKDAKSADEYEKYLERKKIALGSQFDAER